MIYTLLFWIFFSVILYNYLGYTVLMALLAGIKRLFAKKLTPGPGPLPEVTLLIPAYNEIDYVDAKIKNTLELTYPKEKLKVIWVTDGSNDGSVEKLQVYNDITVLHENARNGKIGAVNRAMEHITTPIVVFCDANSMLNKNCIEEIVKPFQHKKTGCVAGQKQILYQKMDKAVGTGEGIYWNYESAIKNLESFVNSTVGAAGELFAIKRELFEKIPGDSIIEDFVISLAIIKKSYKTKFAPRAVSTETASLNISEEMKRKTRIAYGSIQTLFRYPGILNPFKHGFFSFQYFSHKVLRWTLVPVFIPLLFLVNLKIILETQHNAYFDYFFCAQSLFYTIAFSGLILKEKKISFRLFFIPFYLVMMNFSILSGYIRYFKSGQSVAWEKAKRS